MQDVKVSAKAGEAREATGFDLIQWRRFLVPWQLISRLEADRYVHRRPQYTSWIALPAGEQNALWAAINARLDAENIPRINQSVLIWRMSQAMREARRLFVMNQEGGVGEGGDTSQEQAEEEAETVQDGYRSPYEPVRSPPPQQRSPPSRHPAQTETPPRPAYDPVKDAAGSLGGLVEEGNNDVAMGLRRM
ncbi:uncharacterized protein BDZ99DRAFT_468033 [Mytilinidion resinicola]|uniref:Uncharacterized protein n=1 Tax=Mytilinidion resinicola TaxID=574789 RepID=A0A6A6Y5G8_9PEZI|nr:uncharacterized protein BDZ99DRAFT_468033 [Mytilinidion resinicola]KAF2803475.1 hypothetical protein BDZ99DRAFT_468033 [Mytilinidion resinicola]